MSYQAEGVPLIVLAGKEYGSGSSRDWAAKGPRLLGVRAVIAESFERIHRTNLVGMGVLPLEFLPATRAESARPHRPRGVRGGGARRGDRQRLQTAARSPSAATRREGQGDDLPRAGAHRHPAGGRCTTATAASCSTCSASWRAADRGPESRGSGLERAGSPKKSPRAVEGAGTGRGEGLKEIGRFWRDREAGLLRVPLRLTGPPEASFPAFGAALPFFVSAASGLLLAS